MFMHRRNARFDSITKLSELLSVALQDLREVEAMSAYKVDMLVWHEMCDDGACHVCLGGAVLARSIGLDHDAVFTGWSISEKVNRRIVAIDRLRTGYIAGAMRAINDRDLTENERSRARSLERTITDYADDKDEFYKDMGHLALDLEEVGL